MSLNRYWTRDVVVAAVVSGLLISASAVNLVAFSMTEVAGFVTGGVCVWLVVRENVWNWPVRIANSAIYFVVFAVGIRSLLAMMALRVSRFVLRRLTSARAEPSSARRASRSRTAPS